MSPHLQALQTSIALALGTLAFRALPFALWLLFGATIGLRGKLATLMIFAVLVGLVVGLGAPLTDIVWYAPACYAYFVVMTCSLPRARDLTESKRISKPALFALLLLVYLVLPAFVASRASLAVAVMLGWDMVLSAYSFVIDTSGQKRKPPLRDALFFVLINPTVVFAESGKRVHSPRFDRRGLLRVALGVAAVTLSHFVRVERSIDPALAPTIAVWDINSLHAYGVMVRAYVLMVGGLYAAHSGLASMQIGMMHWMGYTLPERYRLPWLATGPDDFWRRWNRWVGSWARRYLYFPTALFLGRSWPRFSQPLKAVAAMATFITIGALHDVATFAGHLSIRDAAFSGATSLLFFSLGAQLVLWIGLSRAPGLRRLKSVKFSRPNAVLSWFLWSHVLILTAACLVPYLRSGSSLVRGG